MCNSPKMRISYSMSESIKLINHQGNSIDPDPHSLSSLSSNIGQT